MTKQLIRGSGMGGGIGSVLYTDSSVDGADDDEGESESRRFFIYNAIGSTVALTNTSSAVMSADCYDAFGKVVASLSGSNDDENRKFCTKERSESIGLDNFGFRYYDYELGKFLTRDPSGYPDGPNNTLYCNNNPINKFDPLGLWEWAKKAWSKTKKIAQEATNTAMKYTKIGATKAYNLTANFTRGTHKHAKEFVKSPYRAAKNSYNNGLNWKTPLDLAEGPLDMVRTAGGYPFSIASGDIFDDNNKVEFDSKQPTISMNGMLNSDGNARSMSRAVQTKLGITKNTSVKNNTHGLGLGDGIQILGNELGFIDITAIRGAEAIRGANNAGSSIDVIAHSQGTMTFNRSLELVDNKATRKKIRYQGFGGEMFNDAGALGLGSATNTWNVGSSAYGDGDLIPNTNYLPTPIKIPNMHRAWNEINTSKNKPSGNKHSFKEYYSDSVKDYTP